MLFYEFAQMLYPPCGRGRGHANFIRALICSIIENDSQDRCPVLNLQQNTLEKIFNGTKPITKRNATYILSSLDKMNYIEFIGSFTSDTIQEISSALANNGICNDGTEDDVVDKSYETLIQILKTTASSNAPQKPKRTGTPGFKESIAELDTLLKALPKPTQILPPEKIEQHEQPYINELFAAYGHAEKIPDFNEDTLDAFPDYGEDLVDRRIDYFSAETIRRGVSEVYEGRFSDQFEVLKDETLAGVKNTARKHYQNGYEKLLAVMEQAGVISVSGYILCSSPFWISNRIKMGTCHFLVNEGKLRWVEPNE